MGARAGKRSQLRIVYAEFVYKLGKEAGIMSWITCMCGSMDMYIPPPLNLACPQGDKFGYNEMFSCKLKLC